jgi:hypothetical protein
VTNLPIDQIRQTVHPTADQEAALDDLSAASSQASDVIKSSCPTSVPLTPIGRLDAAEQRLDATVKALQIVRSPLEKFYQALSDEQKQRFNAMNGSARGHSFGQQYGGPVQSAGGQLHRPASATYRAGGSADCATRAPSTISRRPRKMPATSCNRRVRPRCRYRRWRGSIRSRHG